MNTRIQRPISEEQEEAISALRLTLSPDITRFFSCVSEMEGALTGENPLAHVRAITKHKEAILLLDDIEDAIKRFREGRKQAFEE